MEFQIVSQELALGKDNFLKNISCSPHPALTPLPYPKPQCPPTQRPAGAPTPPRSGPTAEPPCHTAPPSDGSTRPAWHGLGIIPGRPSASALPIPPGRGRGRGRKEEEEEERVGGGRRKEKRRRKGEEKRRRKKGKRGGERRKKGCARVRPNHRSRPHR